MLKETINPNSIELETRGFYKEDYAPQQTQSAYQVDQDAEFYRIQNEVLRQKALDSISKLLAQIETLKNEPLEYKEPEKKITWTVQTPPAKTNTMSWTIK